MNAHVWLATLLAIGCTQDAPLAVAEVELDRFAGGYFEIAKLPRHTQLECTGTLSFYQRVSEDELKVVHECRERTLDGPLRRVAARALVTDREDPAKLALDFGGFFGDYWIIDTADDYRYAVIGHPSREYLWILSRTAGMRQDDFSVVLERAQKSGFDVSRLELTEQGPDTTRVAPGEPSEEVPRLASHGCNTAPGASGRIQEWGLLALITLGALAARRARGLRCHG